jgi:hypothetical protein
MARDCFTSGQQKIIIVFIFSADTSMRTYYNIDGEIDEVVIIYSYKVRVVLVLIRIFKQAA